jgi:hypothetical protein
MVPYPAVPKDAKPIPSKATARKTISVLRIINGKIELPQLKITN